MDIFNRNLELADRFETEYLRILYYDFNSSYKDKYNSYEYSRLCTIINGEKTVEVDNKENLTYGKEDFIILPPYSSVKMDIGVPTKAVAYEISDKLIDIVTEKVNLNLELNGGISLDDGLFHEKSSSSVNMVLEKILNIAISQDKNKEFLIDLYAQEIVYYLLKKKGMQSFLQVNSKNPIQQAITNMQINVTRGITVAEIAYDLGMSPVNFSSKFKKVMGITPNEYLKNLKLSVARKMLVYKSVTEVAYDLGYDNISHFIYLFKDRYGITPKQYVLKQSIEENNINNIK